jgi:putative glycosyltransferase (TIGR04372 family)
LFIRPYPDRGTYSFKKDFETDPRANYDLNSFFATINFLFKNDYQIVLMGNFNNKFVNNKIFKKCINYRNSIYQNPKNDFIITQNCDFAIVAQGGYVVVPPVLGIPTLAINTVYLAGLYDYKKITIILFNVLLFCARI